MGFQSRYKIYRAIFKTKIKRKRFFIISYFLSSAFHTVGKQHQICKLIIMDYLADTVRSSEDFEA